MADTNTSTRLAEAAVAAATERGSASPGCFAEVNNTLVLDALKRCGEALAPLNETEQRRVLIALMCLHDIRTSDPDVRAYANKEPRDG